MLKKYIKYRFLRILIRLMFGLLLFFTLLVLFIRSPWGQGIIVDRVVNYVSGKTGTEVRIDKLYLTFSGNLSLKGLYLEDQSEDTLVYSKSLEVSVALMPLINGDEINVKSVEWKGLTAKVIRPSDSETFNYEFLIDAFAPAPDSTTTTSSTSASPEVIVGNIDFSNFDLHYQDDIEGMKARLNLGQLTLDMDKMNLEDMSFQLDEIFLADSQILYELSNSGPPQSADSNPTSTAPMALPTFSVNDLIFENVQVEYKSATDRTVAILDFGALKLDMPTMDLNKQEILVDDFTLDKSKVFFEQLSIQNTQAKASKPDIEEAISFIWPDWKIEVDNISITQNNIEFKTTTKRPKAGVFNPEWIKLNELNLALNDFTYLPQQAELSIKNLSFIERSGLNLKKFSFDLEVNDEALAISQLNLITKENTVSGKVKLGYSSVERLINMPDSSAVDLNLEEFKIGLSEASIFSPELLNNEYISLISKKPLTGKLALKGKLNNISFPVLSVNWGKQTSLKLSGNITDPLDTALLKMNIEQLDIRTAKSDIIKVVDESNLGITLPDIITLNGSVSGGLSEAMTNLDLKTSSGRVILKGNYKNSSTTSFKADIDVRNLLLGRLIQNQSLDTLSFTSTISGRGSNINELSVQLKTDFSKLNYEGYDFSQLNLEGDIKKGQGDINLSFKDRNLDLALETSVKLDSISPKVNTLLTVKGADLYELGLTQDGIRTAFVLDAEFQGNTTAFTLKSKLREGVAIYKREAYTFGSLDLNAMSNSDSLGVRILSETVNANITANGGIEEALPALQNHLESYFHDVDSIADKAADGDIKLKLDMVLRQAPILSEVFLQGLDRMDSILLKVDFNQKLRQFNAGLQAPYFKYGSSTLDSLVLSVNGAQDTLKFDLGWANVASGPIAIGKTKLEGDAAKGLINSSFSIIDKEDQLVNISSEVFWHGDTIQAKIDPESLILNKKQWVISPQNRLSVSSTRIDLNEFEISNGVQKIILSTTLPKETEEHIGAVFENFELATLTTLLNAEKPLAAGQLKGDIILENPFGSYGLVAGLGITNLMAIDVPLGTLRLDARAVGTGKYNLKLALNGPSTNLDLSGSYIAAPSGADLTLDLDLKNLEMSVLERLYKENISKTNGNISGEVKVSGTVNDPKYAGALNFNQVSFLVNQLNTQFKMAEEQFKIDNSGLYFDNFVITDSENNDFSLDGAVLTKDLTNPVFDLKLKADNFGLINSTKEDSDLFYGQVNMNADLTVQGDLTIPKVRGKLKVVDGSKLTFTVPESQLELKARDGVVIFVNRKNPDDILTRVDQNESSALAASLSGYDIETILSMGENSQFNIIIDEATGDNLQVTGTGDFNLALEPNGRTSLSGKYELSGGHYEANLYNLVKRRFEISPGSSIAWSGDPYDAELKVKAIYSVRTSAGPLMAVKTSAEGIGLENSYQERLPFQVFINVDGLLLQPEISFNLDMSEEDRGAFGGVVYEQVQQLNSQEEELNKQVFSLLVLNRFFPSSGSDGSNGGPASLALDNVNKVLSGQLNNYSEKVFGKTGFDVGFDLNSSTGGQANGGQTQTQLGITAKRELFNDRLIVQVGSEVDVAGQSSSQGAPIVGNVSLEYLLTQDRRLRLKGFSKNEYEGIIDGQLTVSGIALIFTREFNKFKELWAKQVKEEAAKTKEDK